MPRIDIDAVPARKGSGYRRLSMRHVLRVRGGGWARRAGCAISAST